MRKVVLSGQGGDGERHAGAAPGWRPMPPDRTAVTLVRTLRSISAFIYQGSA